MAEVDVTKSADGAVWVEKTTLRQAELTEFAQQITYRHADLECPIRNHHTDVELAQAAGFPKPVAEPLHYLAYFDNVMLGLYEKNWLEHGELQATILGPAFAGDSIELRLGPAEKVEQDGSLEVRHRLAVLGVEGDLLTVGYVSVHRGEHAEAA